MLQHTKLLLCYYVKVRFGNVQLCVKGASIILFPSTVHGIYSKHMQCTSNKYVEQEEHV